MGILKPLSFKFSSGDVDSSGRSLQVLDTVHRSTLMNISRGKVPAGQAHFKDPSGIGSYYGFGADGYYYTSGIQGRIWTQRQCIDDFTDRVTDVERWQGIGSDFEEGGLEGVGSTPFGYRLYAEYAGPAAEIYDRKGKMVRPLGSSSNGVLSGRVAVPSSNIGVNLQNSILLGIQQQTSDLDYVFVGVVKTATNPDSIVQGECVGGVYTITGAVAIPPGVLEVDVAIDLDEIGGSYRGHYSFSPITHDYSGPSWNPVGPVQAFPPGWPANAVPRVHAEFPPGVSSGLRHHLSDVRVEVNGGFWEGQQRASWWLETQDSVRPLDEGGIQAECPDELFITLNRDDDGDVELVLLDVDDPTDPLLWRRWSSFGIFKNVPQTFYPGAAWSPGWLDADEGHIVLTRNTKRWISGAADGDAAGEIWLVSLRWDKVIVFEVNGVGVYLSFYDSVSGRVLREESNLGGRRWKSEETYLSPGTGAQDYDVFQIPQAPNDFVGTLRDKTTEATVPAVTYGVTIRRMDDGEVYLAYGVREVPFLPAYFGEYFSGLVHLDETQPIPQFGRWLFRKDDTVYNVWDESFESWVMVGLSYARALWWLQGGEDGAHDEIEGVLCRRDWSGLLGSPDNPTTSPFLEDDFWRARDLFEGRGMNLELMDSDPAADEILLVSSGWKGGAHLTILWYDSITPSSSVVRTFGVPYPSETPSHDLTHSIPSQEFPRWFSRFDERDDADLKLCRVSGAAAVGADSYFPVSGGLWTLYTKFEGSSFASHVHDMIRGVPIQYGDFVLNLSGKLIPPFAAGYGFSAIDSMSPDQMTWYELRVSGEKEMMARVYVFIRGNSTGIGGIYVGAALSYVTGSGRVSQSNSLKVPSIMSIPGSPHQLRIRRQGGVWGLLFFDLEQGSWRTLIESSGPDLPVIPYLRSSSSDFVGLACSCSMEIESFELAPADDALGEIYYRNVSFSSVSAMMGSVMGGVVLRENVPVPSSGHFLAAEGWVLPGLLPRP